MRATDATKGPSGREDGAKVVLRLKRPEFSSRIGNTVRRAAILGILYHHLSPTPMRPRMILDVGRRTGNQ